jgi:2-furoyl-CoA dehydrogenase FAD binding subunit
MKPPRFDYVLVNEADHAVSLLHEYGNEANILAGGQSLIPMLNMRLLQPGVLLDISQSSSLREIKEVNGKSGPSIEIGAAVTQSMLLSYAEFAGDLQLLSKAMPWISHYQIRNRGTVCGSIAHADPSAELPLCLLALRGQVQLSDRSRRRSLPADQFFTGMLSTARSPEELVESVQFPRDLPGYGYGFREFARRRGDYAICAVAAVSTPSFLRVAVGGVSDLPLAFDWCEFDDDVIKDRLNELAWSLEVRDDPHMSARGKRHLIRTLGWQAVSEAKSGMQRVRS